jgi:hypothetical protein
MAIDPERHLRTVGLVSASRHDVLICSSATEVLLLPGYWPVMAQSVAMFSSYGDVKVIVPEDELELGGKTSATEIIPYERATVLGQTERKGTRVERSRWESVGWLLQPAPALVLGSKSDR